ncbi:MAG: hypothetical protein ACI4JB_07465 [Porcipelethomonas sp.]
MSDICFRDRDDQCSHDCPGCVWDESGDNEPDPDFLYDMMKEDKLLYD